MQQDPDVTVSMINRRGSQVLILNDTDVDGTHFGCLRVMRTIRENLSRRDLAAGASLKVGTDWKNDPAAQAKIEAASLLVINGEGTLHHGKKRGLWLLEAAALAKSKGAKVALINALWQDNPQSWAEIAQDVDVLWCRDSRSAQALSQQIGRAVDWHGDLSMATPETRPSEPERPQTLVSCSVKRNVTAALADFSDTIAGQTAFIPVTSRLKLAHHGSGGLKKHVRELYARFYEWRFQSNHPQFRYVVDDLAYLQELLRSKLLVTGRFHAICLAVLAQTPFIGVASNSWKIEALLADLALDPARLQPLDAFKPGLLDSRDWAFSAEERRSMADRLPQWRQKVQAMFDEIVKS